MRLPVYLDHHATTPVDPRVLHAMLPYFTERFGNAASRTHEFGWQALEAVDAARAQVAAAVRAEPREIVFTSGATESNNLALAGVAQANQRRGNHIITVATEHRAVLDPCAALARAGFEVTILPVRPDGLLDPDRVRDAFTGRTTLVSVMLANNEVGVLQPVAEIGAMAAERGALLHVDAAQALGRVDIDVRRDHIHLMSLSAHKCYGPKGVGALYVRRHDPLVRVEEQMHGGGHEHGRRSGTLNVPGIVGFGEACRIAVEELPTEAPRLAALRDHLLVLLRDGIDGVVVNGSLERRLPNNLNVSVPRVEGESLIMAMRDVAVSSGSACSSADAAPSHVLAALGVPPELAHASLRFGLGRTTTREEIDYAARRVVETATMLRARGL